MARRLEPSAPGSDVGGRGGGVEAAQGPPRRIPTLDLTAPSIIGIAPGEREAVASSGLRQREDARLGAEFDNVPEANSLADVQLLNRVRDGLIELPAPPAQGTPPPLPQRAVDEERELAAIRETFAMVGAGGDDAAAYFYGWLFTASPELRELFPLAMDEQRDRLFAALTTLVGSLRDPGELTRYLAQLGRDHRKYSVRPEMYSAVGSALIGTLRAFAGPAFTPAAEQAWLRIYQTASEVMVRAAEAAEATAPAYWTAQVVGHERRGRSVAVVSVLPDQSLPYLAGQHITVQTGRWPKVWRPFSIACRPRSDGLLALHVKAIPGGWVSNALVKHTAIGDQLILGPAVGGMSLAAAGSRDLLCVAGGTGLAPLKAIAEQVVFEESQAKTHRNVALFWGARHEGELYDLKDLWQLSDSYPWLQVYPVTSEDKGYPGMRGSVGQLAARYLPHLECEAYVAGPPDMVRQTRDLLGEAGLPSARIHYDDGLLTPRRRVGSGT